MKATPFFIALLLPRFHSLTGPARAAWPHRVHTDARVAADATTACDCARQALYGQGDANRSRPRVEAGHGHPARRLPSRRGRLVPRPLRRAHAGAGTRAWPAIRAGQRPWSPHPPARARRLLLPRRDRCTGARGCGERRHAAGRDTGGLRVAAEGAVQRHPHQPRRATGGHSRRAGKARPARRGDPHRRTHRRHAAARARSG